MTRSVDRPERSESHCAQPKRPAITSSRPKGDAFANQKGGVPDNTTLNLSAAFADKGHRRCCAWTWTPHGNLTMSQGIDPDSLEISMYDVPCITLDS